MLVVPDINVLIHAFRTDAEHHETYATWLRATLRDERLGIADVITTGFLRIVTHPRIFAEPTPTAAALDFIDAITARSRTSWLQQGAEPWQRLATIARADNGVRANLIPNAHIAALCLSNGAHLATRDRGFTRFPGLRFFDPAA